MAKKRCFLLNHEAVIKSHRQKNSNIQKTISILNKKRPLPVLLDSGLRLYGFVDIDSAFELELDIVFSFDLYAVDYAKAKGKQVDIIKVDLK